MLDLTGQVSGNLNAIKAIENSKPKMWLCLCNCGNYTEISAGSFKRRSSCGCHKRSNPSIDGKKKCNRCNQIKRTSEYHRSKASKDGLTNYCKKCNKERKQKYRKKKPKAKQGYKFCSKCKIEQKIDNFSKRKQRLYSQCKTCVKKRISELDFPRTKTSKTCSKCKKLRKAKSFSTHKRKKDGLHSWCKYCVKERNKNHLRTKWKTDIQFRIKKTLRARFYQLIKRGALAKTRVSKRFNSMISCTVKKVKEHIESQFKEGMSWDNYGLHGWHIDHIIPLSSFDLTDPEQQKKAFHYTNLQPLWAKENLSKGAKLPKEISNE